MGKYTNIDDPSAHFQTLLWTGNSTDARALTNDGNSDLQPDWVWLKNRDLGYNHFLTDSSRGNTKVLLSDSTSAEGTYTNMVESFDTNGFTVGFDGSQVPNFNGNTFVGWQWKANGGSTSSNTDGSITSTVQANQDAGFSIVTWTGNTTGSSQTIGHGLGAAPKTIIVKDRDSTAVWVSYHEPLGTGKYLQLNSNAAQGSISNYWSSTAPSSTVFGVIGDNGGVGYANNVSGNNMIAYCFAEKQGYSKFGSYIGNGSPNGPFVYTGFKPAFIMVKKSNSAGGWVINDCKRIGHNPNNYDLYANANSAEEDNDRFDLLSNGFKAKSTSSPSNSSGASYIYMAFAESPFVTSTGIMGTAR